MLKDVILAGKKNAMPHIPAAPLASINFEDVEIFASIDGLCICHGAGHDFRRKRVRQLWKDAQGYRSRKVQLLCLMPNGLLLLQGMLEEFVEIRTQGRLSKARTD
jgi:hypothetical protein